MNISNADDAIKVAAEYYAQKYPALAGVSLAGTSFEGGWLVGPAANDPSVANQLGITLLIVDQDGTITESSSSIPPTQIINDYLSMRQS